MARGIPNCRAHVTELLAARVKPDVSYAEKKKCFTTTAELLCCGHRHCAVKGLDPFPSVESNVGCRNRGVIKHTYRREIRSCYEISGESHDLHFVLSFVYLIIL